jgi:hypothetical protein
MVLKYSNYINENKHDDFNIGDRVLYIYNEKLRDTSTGLRNDLFGFTGTIIGDITYSSNYAVEFDKEFSGGHDCDNQGKYGFCYYVNGKALKLIEIEDIKEEDIEWF